MQKKVTLMVIGLLFVAGFAFSAVEDVVVPYILKAPAPITVDCNLNEWAFAFPINFNREVMRDSMRFSQVPGWVPATNEDCSGTIYMMYDADNFYYAAKVTDATPGHWSEASWAADAIEFYMANWDVGKDKVVPTTTADGWIDDATTGQYSFQLNMSFSVSLDTMLVQAFYGPASPITAGEHAWQLTDDGYILEGYIPLSALTSTATGNTFEFPEGGRIPCMWSLYNMDESENSANFGGYAYTKFGYAGWMGVSPGFQVADVLPTARGEVWANQAQFDFVAPFVKKVADGHQPMIDGDLHDWNNVFPIDFRREVMTDSMRFTSVPGWVPATNEDCSGTLYMMYDADNFYFAANVTDATPGHWSEASWAADAIEFYMANWDIGMDQIVGSTTSDGWIDDATTGNYSFQLNTSFSVSLDTILTQAFYGPASPVPDVEQVWVLTNAGYILEGKIPLASLVSTATGNTFEFTEGFRSPCMWSLYNMDESENSANFGGYAYTKIGYAGWMGVTPGWQYVDVKGLDWIDDPAGGIVPNGIRESKTVVPNELSIGNSPNPFNPSTQISFTLTASGKSNLVIYNQMGQVVKTVFNGMPMTAGLHNVNVNMSDLPSGCYIAVLAQGQQRISHKMMLMK